MRRLFLALIAALCLFACINNKPPDNPPGPDGGSGGVAATGGSPATGGAFPTGGAPGTGGEPHVDGKALCVAATLASPDRLRQARDNGLTIQELADSVCSLSAVQQCFANGVCK